MASSIAVKNLPYLWKSRDLTSGAGVSSSVLTHNLIDEHHFVRMLRVERKRTERSGKPFMLMLLDGGDLFATEEILNQVVSALTFSIRETDSLGWYETGSILGILFTELGTADNSVIELIFEKVAASLREQISSETDSKITLTYHIYPESGDHHKKGSADIRLYPDLPRIAARKRDRLDREAHPGPSGKPDRYPAAFTYFFNPGCNHQTDVAWSNLVSSKADRSTRQSVHVPEVSLDECQ